jgi:hypothetical protein
MDGGHPMLFAVTVLGAPPCSTEDQEIRRQKA